MDYLEKLDNIRKAQGFSRCDLARQAGLSDNTIYNWYNNRKCQPTIFALEKVCEVLNLTLSSFFADNSFDDLSPDQIELLHLWSSLDEGNKKSLLNILHTLSNKNQ